MPNKRKILNILRYIETHPEEWDQRYWVEEASPHNCGTTFCFAGFAVARSKDYHLLKTPQGRLTDLVRRKGDNRGYPWGGDGGDAGDYDWLSIRSAAIEILELTDFEASELFTQSNDTLPRLRTAVEAVLAGKYWGGY